MQVRKTLNFLCVWLLALPMFDAWAVNTTSLSYHSNGNRVIEYLQTPSCIDCAEWLEKESLEQCLRIKKNDLGYVRVRKNAECFEVKFCSDNLLGTVDHGKFIFGIGPVKNVGGIAYVVKIKDKDGRFYRGYISSTVIDGNCDFK